MSSSDVAEEVVDELGDYACAEEDELDYATACPLWLLRAEAIIEAMRASAHLSWQLEQAHAELTEL